MSAQTITSRQWLALDAVRALDVEQVARRGRVFIDDVVDRVRAKECIAAGVAKRLIADLKRIGFVDAGEWHVWLTDAGRAFLDNKSMEGK